MNIIQKAWAFVARNTGKIMAAGCLLASSVAARADDADLASTVTTQLTSMKTVAAGVLAVAILIPVGFKVYGIVKRALNKA